MEQVLMNIINQAISPQPASASQGMGNKANDGGGQIVIFPKTSGNMPAIQSAISQQANTLTAQQTQPKT
jgi:hypothetical protein